MSKQGFPKLCGGVYFSLILKALKTKASAEEHYQGIKDGLDDQSVLIGLIKIINKDYIELLSGSFKTITSDYKNFKRATSDHLPFGEPTTVTAFDNLVHENYVTAFSRMANFIDRFIDIGKDNKNEVWLVKALLEIINNDVGDDGISDEQPFYCLENGDQIKKRPKNGRIKNRDPSQWQKHTPLAIFNLVKKPTARK